MVLRLIAVVGIAIAISMLINLGADLTDGLSGADQQVAHGAMLLTALLIYALLMATPFVPGIEIGLALLVLRGPEVAPAVYLATAAGLCIAYMVGRMVPMSSSRRIFADLRLHRTAEMIDRLGALPPEDRVALLEARLPRWARTAFRRLRYVALAMLFNLPGNSFIGGGGGLALMAGLSGVFRPGPTFATIFLAILPAPLIFWLWGDLIPLDWLPLPA